MYQQSGESLLDIYAVCMNRVPIDCQSFFENEGPVALPQPSLADVACTKYLSSSTTKWS